MFSKSIFPCFRTGQIQIWDQVTMRLLEKFSLPNSLSFLSVQPSTERTLDMERLQREAVSLREQIQEEQRRRSSRVLDLQEQLRGIEGLYKNMLGWESILKFLTVAVVAVERIYIDVDNLRAVLRTRSSIASFEVWTIWSEQKNTHSHHCGLEPTHVWFVFGGLVPSQSNQLYTRIMENGMVRSKKMVWTLVYCCDISCCFGGWICPVVSFLYTQMDRFVLRTDESAYSGEDLQGFLLPLNLCVFGKQALSQKG